MNDSEIVFKDITEDRILSPPILTNDSGYATHLFAFNDTFTAGQHIILAEWGSIINFTPVFLRGGSNLNLTLPNSTTRSSNFDFSGFLIDNVTGKGLADQNITFYWNGSLQQVSVITDSAGFYFGSFPANVSVLVGPKAGIALYLGLVGIITGNISLPQNITVFGTYVFSYDRNPYINRINTSVSLFGTLTFDNSTPVLGEDVAVFWDNGTINLINTTTTNLVDGNFFQDHRIPFNHTGGSVQSFCVYNTSLSYFLNATSASVQILVSTAGIVFLNATPTILYTNETLLINGTVEDARGDPTPATVVIRFNGTLVGSSMVADALGRFNLTGLPVGVVAGRYIIDVDVIGPAHLDESLSYSVEVLILSYTDFADWHVNTTAVLPGESVRYRGFLTQKEIPPGDSWGPEVQNHLVYLYRDGVFLTTTITSSFQPDSSEMVYGWNFEFTSVIPLTANEGYVNFTVLFNGSTYLEPFSQNFSMYVFRSAIVGFDVNARVLWSTDTLIIFGNVNDTQGHPLNNRNISLFWIINGDITRLGSIITNSDGWFTLSYAIPLTTQGNATVYARCEEAQSTISDQIIIEVVQMQIPTNPLDFILQILTPLNLAIAAIGISGV
ncbi:MAG: carboxypeptidase-like regulatory domain-containing protein, partial [Candidatus Ranarchaeia archaeon]